MRAAARKSGTEPILRVGFVVALLVSCVGVSVESAPEEDAGAGGTGGSSGNGTPNGARGGAITGGRTGTTGGRGGTTGGRGGTTGGVGGNSTPTGGVGGACAADLEAPGLGGEGGEGGGASDCDELGSIRLAGHRCENTESYAQGPGYERVDCATTIDDCFAACRARPDCTAVADYFEMRPAPGCYLVYASCAEPTKPDYAEEDGGRTHEKICVSDGSCRFREILDNYECGPTGPEDRVENAQSIDDCKGLCLTSPACTAVRDYFYGVDVPGCYLVTSSCSAPVENYQDGVLYPRCSVVAP